MDKIFSFALISVLLNNMYILNTENLSVKTFIFFLKVCALTHYWNKQMISLQFLLRSCCYHTVWLCMYYLHLCTLEDLVCNNKSLSNLFIGLYLFLKQTETDRPGKFANQIISILCGNRVCEFSIDSDKCFSHIISSCSNQFPNS